MGSTIVRIQRHTIIRHAANPYEPEWESYFEARWHQKLSGTLAGSSTLRWLWRAQQGRCPVCGQLLPEVEEDWQVQHRHWRVYGGGDELTNLELVHEHCHRQLHAAY